ncbi:MAG TPA: serine/threonine-protein kinase [Verrucomicrobiales bacterium]|nr:serine/threonine-protein kinase [Verrucomicrobiales bacterium]
MTRPVRGADAYHDLVEGHEILEELGRGGMGVVFLAREHHTGRDVALKMLLPLESGDDELRERFQREAKALADLDHPAILPLYQVGEADDLPYFTMKFAGGGTLAQRLKLEGRWLARPAAELIIVLADGLHCAHEHGIIHRDIKPGNILFDEEGRPYIADFGLAKLLDSDRSFTRSAGIMGTLAYLAPEIPASGARAATISSDVYSLGAVLYELLAGRPPFVVEGTAALLRKISEDEPETPSSLNSRVPRDLEIICLKCLSKSPGDRYSSSAALADDLRCWLRGEPILARRITSLQRLGKWARRRPALASLSAALILLTLGSGLWLAWSNHQLNLALSWARKAQSRADQRAEFVLGGFGESLEAIGRFELLNAVYQDLLAWDNASDEAGLNRRVRLLTRWGKCLGLEGRHSEAERPLREAVMIAGKLPEGVSHTDVYIDAVAELSRLVAEIGSFDEAVTILKVAEERIKRSIGANAHRLLADLADVYTQIGLTSVFSHPQIGEWAARAVSLRRSALASSPGDSALQFQLAQSLRYEGESFERAAREKERKKEEQNKSARTLWLEAKKRFEEARSIAVRLDEQKGAGIAVNAAWEREIAQNTGWLGEVELALDPSATTLSRDLRSRERDILDQLSERDPLDWRAQIELLSAEKRLGSLAEAQGDISEADIHRGRQADVFDRISRLAPAARSWRLIAMNSGFNLGKWHLTRGQKEKAARYFDIAWETAKKVLAMRPATPTDQDGFVELARGISEEWKAKDEWDTARRVLVEGISFVQTLPAEKSISDACLWTTAALERRIADLAEHRENMAEALDYNLAAMRHRAEALRSGLWKATTDDPDAVPNAFLASEKSLLTLKRINEAVAVASEALELRRECASVPVDPHPWADAIITAAESGLKAGGDTAQNARRLASRALNSLYPSEAGPPSAPPTLAPYVPKPEDAEKHRERALRRAAVLKRIATLPEVPTSP